MKHRLKHIRPPTTPRVSITITLTVLASLLAVLASILGNLASTTLSNALKPYLSYVLPALGLVVFLGLIVAIWQVWYASGQPANNGALSTPTLQAKNQATALTPASLSIPSVAATTPLSQPAATTPSLQNAVSSSSQPTAATMPSPQAEQVPSSGTRPVPSVSPAPAAVSGSAHYHTCVISYSTKDEPFVTRLYADLKAHGVPCWLADQDGTMGNKLRAEIYQAIDQLDKLLLVLSKNAIESLWVEEEVDVALDREHQQPGTWLLFPLRLDDTVFTTKKYWAITVRQRRIGDFRQWQDDAAYQQALQRVLRDLRV